MSPRSLKPDSSLAFPGRAVVALRAEAGLTRGELAERTGLHRTYIGRIERGERNLTWTALGSLARGLGVPR